MKNRYLIYFILLFWVLVLATGCSTKKATFFNKTYHNVSAHYNVWWNGNESLKEAVKTLQKQSKDDYTQILSVYQLGTREEAVAQNSHLDRATEKANKGIKKHSINIKGKEYVVWVQNCYLLLAKAQYYKQDYGLAAPSFRYITSQFKDSKQAYQAMVWYARSMIAEEQYTVAESTLDQLKTYIENGKAPKNLKKALFMAYAECAIKQKKYHFATQYLNIAIEEGGSRKENTRLYFIMGQIYQETNKKNTAIKYYEKVLKRGSVYEMEFNTRLNIASCYNVQRGSANSIIRSLEKMLKDRKNTEYKDQIYYALGEVSMISKNATQACEYWKTSIEESQNNTPQKIKSSLTLANTYYDLFEDYVSAHQYYDTAINLMTNTYPKYDEIKSRQSTLNTLVSNIKEARDLDTLLVFSEMTPAEREKVAERKVTELRKKEQEQAAKEMEKMYAAQSTSTQSNLKGNWYFYNTSTVQRGKESFIKTWGRRVLEDNWRLSEKQSSFAFEEQHTAADTAKNASGKPTAKDSKPTDSKAAIDTNKAQDPHNKEYYLNRVLTTKAEKDSANKEIAVSLLSMAFIYNDVLKNERKAIEALTSLIERYPEYEQMLPAYYLLYRIYDRKGDTPNANYYKNMILRGFPDSDYAYLIRDENYYQEMVRREKLAETEYYQTYATYQKRRYKEVISMATSANEAYRDPDLMPKFLYLEALASGKLRGKDILLTKLDNVVASYPKSEIVPMVKEQIQLLRSGKMTFYTETEEANYVLPPTDSTTAQTPTTAQPTQVEQTVSTADQTMEEAIDVYRYRANVGHYFVMVIDPKNLDVNNLKSIVADFCRENFKMLDLRVSNFLFTGEREILMVQQFESAKTAMDFYLLIQKNNEIMQKLSKTDTLFVISMQNYATFYNQRKVDVYEYFFNKYYKK